MNYEHNIDESELIKKLDIKIDRERIKDKDDNSLKLVETVFDEKTRLILFNMMMKGYFDKIEGAISTGKEANVYYAQSVNKTLAIKIYRIDSPSFRKMRPYIEGDHRFKKIRNKRSGFIELWAKKEFKNLKRMKENGIPAPEPIYVERNILLMEFLGDKNAVLPTLRECTIKKPIKLYKQIIESIKQMYIKCKLIHADLSEYNILYNTENEEFFIIDVSQAVLDDHPKADEFLLRDIKNINLFFAQHGVKIIDLAKLFKWITSRDVDDILLYELDRK